MQTVTMKVAIRKGFYRGWRRRIARFGLYVVSLGFRVAHCAGVTGVYVEAEDAA